MPGYQGVEVSATPAGGVIGKYATEAYQTSYYLQTLWRLACDPNVRVVNIFHLVDEPELSGWQSGLYWYSPTAPIPKQSAAVVAGWITQTGGVCPGKQLPWRPAAAPVATLRR